jgi:histidinol dehydrogenase
VRIIESRNICEVFLRSLKKRAMDSDGSVEKTVRAILYDVRMQGDKAVARHTKTFDKHECRNLLITPEEILRYAGQADREVIKALKFSAQRIRVFHEKQKEITWSFQEKESLLGQIIKPIARTGVYIPGGKAAYPSTVLMNVIPAQVAGVSEIALCVPTPRGEINPYVMAAVKLLGIKEVYRIGGAQAIGAMAYGTKTVRKVDKIVGPGNIYVAVAKRMVFGEVDIDMIAGPSEVLIIADELAPPSFIAADLLSQAEHDEHASAVLLTDSLKLARTVRQELDIQLKLLKRKDIAGKALKAYGAIIITKNLTEAAELANRIAPEHLEVMTKSPKKILPLLRNAGAIFLGAWTPEALGDYAAGPNHTLPTGGTARFSSPLGVYDFIKRSSLVEFTRSGFMELASVVETIADIEGLEAHGNSIRIRKGAAFTTAK